MDYKLIVGLEIHVQLCTKTKLFCGCELGFGERPNSRVCPVCLGMPGVLPVMNRQAFEYAVMAGLALGCDLAEFTKWDRKSYYYPDLPKNYQISQYDIPFSSGGYIEIPAGDGQTKEIRLVRVHLEEDAGKNLHTSGNYSQVDLNRAGTPLLEIVTEPDMNSPEQVRDLAMELQRIVRYLGISEGDMQKGHMRFEPNVNLVISKDGKEFKTPIVEIKNLNSFRALEKSVAYEVHRQLDEFERGGNVMAMGNKSTRGWDDQNEVTVLQREKEEAHDYRYFPDPDLLPVELEKDWFEKIKSQICELPLHRQMRYVNEYGLSEYDAGVLTGEKSTADLFDATVQAGGGPKRVCNLLTQVGLQIANDKECCLGELNVQSGSIAQLAKMLEEGKVNASAGEKIFQELVGSDESPEQIAERLELTQKNDAGELEQLVDEALEQNPQAVEQVKAGGKKSKKARGFLMGQVMQKTRGRANPKVVSELLGKKLS